MKIQWLKNKHNEKFYPLVHAKGVVCGVENENTLDNIIDALNERIDQVASSSSGTRTLLWTNPNPTGSFSAQNIVLDLSKYSKVLIKFKSTSSTTELLDFSQASRFYYYTDEVFVGENSCKIFGVSGQYMRPAKVNTNGIEFGTINYFNGAWYSNGASFNTYGIPCEIYGIK